MNLPAASGAAGFRAALLLARLAVDSSLALARAARPALLSVRAPLYMVVDFVWWVLSRVGEKRKANGLLFE